jgi:hypothetical protein
MITIRFTADEVASVGLPHRGAYISFTDQGRYEDNSTWLDKQPRFEPGIDQLVALADQIVATIH